MIEAIVSSKTRIKLLLKFFLNSNTISYLRNLESEFGESTNAIRIELNRMEDAGLLDTFSEGNKKMFRANIKHPLFREIHNVLLKHLGLDQIIENVIQKLGDLHEVYLTGEFAKGLDSPIIDLVFVGEIDKSYLYQLVEKAEPLVKRKIRFMTFSKDEYESVGAKLYTDKPFLLWANGK